MVSAENLIERLNKWEERMDDQYAKADAAGEIFAAAATARVGTSAVHSIDKIAQEAPLKQRIRDLEQQLAMKDALLAAAQLALHAQQSATSALPTPSPDSLRVILKTLIQGNAAIGPEDIDAYDDASPPVESEARNGTDDAR